MSAIATPPELEPEEIQVVSDDKPGCELVHGELREINVSKEASRISGRLYFALEAFVRMGHPGWVYPEGTSYRCFPDDPKGYRRADASFISIDRMPLATYEDEGHCTTAPDLVVEVISPNDLAEELEEKREEWLAAGVKLVWIVSPTAKTIQVYRADGTSSLLRAADTLTAESVLPGFSCSVSELFRVPGSAK
ncbi:MAG TPA: Uma2 family endonuclease [Urbifossiella sp.]